jgi:hypothetical protein
MEDHMDALGMGGGGGTNSFPMQLLELREELAKAELENKILRKHLSMIVGDSPVDYLMSNVEIARAALKVSVTDKMLRSYVADAITSVIHPEFGTGWREPDGELYKMFNARP